MQQPLAFKRETMQTTIPDDSSLKDTFAYEVDDYDTICRSGSSDSFGHRINDESYLSTNINFDSMFTDDKTRAVFRKLLTHSRNHMDVVSFPYRCDTVTMCQYYRLTVSISGARRVMFFNKLLGCDSRQNEVRWDRISTDGDDAISLCSICNKLSVIGEWLEFQELVDTNLWPASGKEMNCAYTVCDQCEQGINQRIHESLKFSKQ